MRKSRVYWDPLNKWWVAERMLLDPYPVGLLRKVYMFRQSGWNNAIKCALNLAELP